MPLLSRFEAIALSLTFVMGAGMAYHLSHKFSPEVLTAALPIVAPEAGKELATPKGLGTAVFAGGCFWGMQSVFQHTQGVVGAVSGYAGGPAACANYTDVSTGSTGHAEPLHQNYVARYSNNDYVAQFDAPKLLRFKAFLPHLYRASPVLVP
jgi:hypothetical protein